MSGSSVAVVVLTHNRAADVTRTVEHMRGLPERPSLIVVDNASSDGTAAALARFADVQVVRLARNAGAAGRNAGIALARAPYVALCDDDTWWAPGALTRARTLLETHPEVAIVTGRVLVGPEAREDPTCAVMATTPLAPVRGVPYPRVLGFLAGASMVRRDALLDVGGFHPAFFLGGEEKLVAVDLASRGSMVAYAAGVVVHHHPSARRDGEGRRRLLVRNALWFTWLRRPAPRALAVTLRWLGAAARDRVLMAGLVDAVRGGAWVLRSRHVVTPAVEQALRALDDAFDVVPPRAPQPASFQYRSASKTSA
jgi:GT2 family glycosyltransferase